MCTLECDLIRCKLRLVHMLLDMGQRIYFVNRLYLADNRYLKHIQVYKRYTDHLASQANMSKFHYCIQRSQHRAMDYMHHELDVCNNKRESE